MPLKSDDLDQRLTLIYLEKKIRLVQCLKIYFEFFYLSRSHFSHIYLLLSLDTFLISKFSLVKTSSDHS